MMKKRMLRLLFELMKNAKRSDREIAKIIGVSQPTITRMRQRLEKTAIVDYTIIPDWTELGFEIMATTLLKADYQNRCKKQRSGFWKILTLFSQQQVKAWEWTIR